jgi:hypothetical protein
MRQWLRLAHRVAANSRGAPGATPPHLGGAGNWVSLARPSFPERTGGGARPGLNLFFDCIFITVMLLFFLAGCRAVHLGSHHAKGGFGSREGHAIYGLVDHAASYWDYARCADLVRLRHGRFRVAVAFYGLIRNISTTLPSIQKHVFDELEKNDISYDVFVHSYFLVRRERYIHAPHAS